jgi:hypothetical protein
MQEYQRRYRALREKKCEHKLDCMIVPGAPARWWPASYARTTRTLALLPDASL